MNVAIATVASVVGDMLGMVTRPVAVDACWKSAALLVQASAVGLWHFLAHRRHVHNPPHTHSLTQHATMSTTRVPIWCIGDSITQHAGWLHELSEWYARAADCTNRGYSGYNTTAMLHIQVCVC